MPTATMEGAARGPEGPEGAGAPDVTTPWAQSGDDVAAALGVDPGRGLAEDEVAVRVERFGRNEVERDEGTSRWQLVVDQFLSPIVGLLVAAGVAAALAGEIVEAIAVVVAVLVNAVIGYVTEARALSSVESLQELGRTTATVRRGGSLRDVDGADLVPGDVVTLEEGDVVPADLRMVDVANLTVDEAPLTGESEPVDKAVDAVAEDAPLAERASMVFKGTRVTVGSGTGIVTATGAATQIGEVSTLVEEAEGDDQTPLEEQLDRLGRALIGAVVVVAFVVAGAGIAVGQPVQKMIETAIALAVAAVPEGLPVVATLALARGVLRMSRRNALVKRLASVETLGAANVIFTDKTGTLTEGRMRVRSLLVTADDGTLTTVDADADDPRVRAALVVGALCGNAELADDEGDDHVGDPMEVALQLAARERDLGDRSALLALAPERREVAFDRDTKMMATYHELPDGDEPGLPTGDGLLVAVKGAPEAVLAACDRDAAGPLDDDRRAAWIDAEEDLAGKGMRLLGLARRVVQDQEADPYVELELLGMVGLVDPPRSATADAVAACRRAGVEVVMVTGDQPATAAAIAREVGLVDDDDAKVWRGSDIPPRDEWDEQLESELRATRVFARLAPRQKLDLIDLAQEGGAVVGMTGDGVNDAPALKSADIGIAMGGRGTQVARDAADIVLQDDAFETIVEAIREGRNIFGNIRRFVVYLLSGNLGEILAVTLAAISGAALPLLPLQILFINLVSDVFPAAALGLTRGDDTVLDEPPREPGTPIMGRDRWVQTVLWAVLIGGATLATFAWALGPAGLDTEVAVTISFMAFVIARLLHVANMRDPRSGVLRNTIVRSPVVWAALGVSFGLLLLGLYVPPLADVLGVVTPGVAEWGLALVGGGSVLVVGQAALWLLGRREAARAE